MSNEHLQYELVEILQKVEDEGIIRTSQIPKIVKLVQLIAVETPEIYGILAHSPLYNVFITLYEPTTGVVH